MLRVVSFHDTIIANEFLPNTLDPLDRFFGECGIERDQLVSVASHSAALDQRHVQAGQIVVVDVPPATSERITAWVRKMGRNLG